ncbi:hypothetical protein [Yersinia aleksiciae]|uniref:Uncharacterized protein n=1 Tax=Yersinia aleksiciae TaxID=263819 RepID=A0A0T9T5Y0_YERAE|nr:hypothetical protein [Yersinia aleksiciae]AKP33988.1 hypothetical protein ACZ76_10770 [Yersinia aleksiciae]MDA5498177.1 hypothetical protein [Yersinia aleksiciae]MDN0125095.1 hypothetical protein [Yersinia aleksiciae]NIL00405.1 hypothetical protein [Yersinia aleksiciae]WQC70430.1 hypothetical protein N0K21_17685 [Yersinia aleksiciae]
MSRIDIEGALSLLSGVHFGDAPPRLGTKREQQQFARYLPPRPRSSQDMAQAMASTGDGNPMQTEYCIVSGPLSGTRISVSLAIHGLNIVLSHVDRDLIERLQRVQTRWQRQLHALGFPCLLEVTHVGEPDG